MRRKTLDQYYDFLRRKSVAAEERGLKRIPELNPQLFGYQEHCTEFLLRIGCGAALLDTGLGKSFIELEYGRVIAEHTNLPVLMLAPLAVGQQHEREAERFGIDARYVREPRQIKGCEVWITNYERLHKFQDLKFSCLILDESSILKGFTGRTSRALIDYGQSIPYRLAATATPAPNDHMELGQHSAFVGAMPSNEMLARWFIADQSQMGKYRLKHYGVADFWAWVASWARMATLPSDMGFPDDGFILPKLKTNLHFVDVDIADGARDGELFRLVDTSATSIHKEKRKTARPRAERIAEVVDAERTEPWVIWCETDYEADELIRAIPHAVEVRGSMNADTKEGRLNDFVVGNERILITKPSIAGYGLNLQHCARCAFAGLSFSYENYYQAIRRFWRFGQSRPVEVHIALAETEAVIWNTIKRKSIDHEKMKREMNVAMKKATMEHGIKLNYNPTQVAKMPKWLEMRA